jgi:hypothetical protein
MRVGPTIVSTGSKVSARRHLREQRFAKCDRQVRKWQSERGVLEFAPHKIMTSVPDGLDGDCEIDARRI